MEHSLTPKEIALIIVSVGQIICYILILFQIIGFKKDLDRDKKIREETRKNEEKYPKFPMF